MPEAEVVRFVARTVSGVEAMGETMSVASGCDSAEDFLSWRSRQKLELRSRSRTPSAGAWSRYQTRIRIPAVYSAAAKFPCLTDGNFRPASVLPPWRDRATRFIGSPLPGSSGATSNTPGPIALTRPPSFDPEDPRLNVACIRNPS